MTRTCNGSVDSNLIYLKASPVGIEMFITTQMVFDESQYAIQLNAERFYSFLKLKPVVMVKFVE